MDKVCERCLLVGKAHGSPEECIKALGAELDARIRGMRELGLEISCRFLVIIEKLAREVGDTGVFFQKLEARFRDDGDFSVLDALRAEIKALKEGTG